MMRTLYLVELLSAILLLTMVGCGESNFGTPSEGASLGETSDWEAEVLADTPTYFWKMDDGEDGTLRDSGFSSEPKDLNLLGAYDHNTRSMISSMDKTISLNPLGNENSGHMLSPPTGMSDFPLSTSYTFEMWIPAFFNGRNGPWMEYFSYRDPGVWYDSFTLFRDPNPPHHHRVLYDGAAGGPGYFTDIAEGTRNYDTHWVWVGDGAELRVYENGVLVFTDPDQGAGATGPGGFWTPGGDFIIGGVLPWGDAPGGPVGDIFFPTSTQGFAIYDYPLPEDRILKHYGAGTPCEPGC